MATSAESIDLGVVSVCGPVRRENQDAALAWRGQRREAFVIVSDGMGGHESGRKAAEIVVRACSEAIRNRDGQPWRKVLWDALELAHRRILNAVDLRSGSGMGATAVLGSIDSSVSPPVLNLAHVGDSRAYLCRGNSIYRLTSDHSLVGQMVRDGYLTEEEAFDHPDNNVIQRALGQSAPLEPEVQDPMNLEDGDTLLLSSDGLHGVVTDAEILKVVRRSSSCAEVCESLLEAALEAGSADNVSVACVRLPESRRRPRPTRPSR